ncbi:MAG: triose-phosphate isomerase [Saprospiraceae bacterium]|nr:triose-phosphate isomerase [Saprospiraceae bacterium]
MRQKIAAGNWKMNNTLEESVALAQALVDAGSPSGVLTILGVPYVYLDKINQIVAGAENIEVAAQNAHQELSGAFTGEISVKMLNSIGVKYVILGHSERREYFGETDELLLAKTNTVLGAGQIPIFCCGEPLAIRKAGTHITYVIDQLKNSIFKLSAEDFSKIIIAYEPIWAIGTGETASPAQAQEMHEEIRKAIAEVFGNEIAEGTSILYGGSVNAANAKDLFSNKDVDGGLVGGASLKADVFVQVMNGF